MGPEGRKRTNGIIFQHAQRAVRAWSCERLVVAGHGHGDQSDSYGSRFRCVIVLNQQLLFFVSLAKQSSGRFFPLASSPMGLRMAGRKYSFVSIEEMIHTVKGRNIRFFAIANGGSEGGWCCVICSDRIRGSVWNF